jgi:hypothetical protein
MYSQQATNWTVDNCLIEDTSAGNLVGVYTDCIVGQDPLLAALTDNGGFTKTYSIGAGSPALNSGTTTSLLLDQRGFSIVGNRDIGAYESGGVEKVNPTFTNFNDQAKYYFDGSYTIVAPTSNSSGLLSYTSSDGAVATISGTTVTINGAGNATITATQAGDATYNSGSITYVLTVTAVSVLTKSGEISTTNPNYVNKNGGIGTGIALSRNGAILAAKTPPPPIAIVGDIREGGVVFWVDGNGGGLVCALSDYATQVEWGCYGDDLLNVPNVPSSVTVRGSGAEIGHGESNTNSILADCPSAPAALAARFYGPEWFLPSVNELNEMHVNKVTLEAVAGFIAFGNKTYWSSTEHDITRAWYQYFVSGYYFDDKNVPNYVRAVRAF